VCQCMVCTDLCMLCEVVKLHECQVQLLLRTGNSSNETLMLVCEVYSLCIDDTLIDIF